MRDIANFNFQAFEDGMWMLRDLGHDVVSPHEIDIAEGLVASWHRNGLEGHRVFDKVELTPAFSLEAALRRDFAEITHCDVISFLPGWFNSEGCRKELSVAKWCGLDVYIHDPKGMGAYFEPMRGLMQDLLVVDA